MLRSLIISLCSLSAAWLPAQGEAPTKIIMSDPEVGVPQLAFADATHLKIEARATAIHFEVIMREPLAEGMFTCVWVLWDCDDNLDTGINGCEVWTRSGVGSRFRPNGWRPPMASITPPLELKRSAYSVLHKSEVGSRISQTWLHTGTFDAPQIEGKKIRFAVPQKILSEQRGRYNEGIKLFVQVITSCSDQPLVVTHSCGDEGLGIVCDGKDADWLGGASMSDPPDELHPTVKFMDLIRLRVDHGPEELCAVLNLQTPGFSGLNPEDDDIHRADTISVFVEPLGVRYQNPRQAKVRFGRPRANGSGWIAAIEKGVAEFSFNRKAGQNKWRVLAWSDARRIDRIPDDDWLSLKLGGK